MFRYNSASSSALADFGILSTNTNYDIPFGMTFTENQDGVYYFMRYNFSQRIIRIKATAPI